MNTLELIQHVATASKLSKTDSERAVKSVFDGITQALKKGASARFVGFGTFMVSQRNARVGRNPRTGTPIKISASRAAKFRAGKELKDAVK
jgi:DNA-binding protein HU-beta